jgi:hypothetical protein
MTVSGSGEVKLPRGKGMKKAPIRAQKAESKNKTQEGEKKKKKKKEGQ